MSLAIPLEDRSAPRPGRALFGPVAAVLLTLGIVALAIVAAAALAALIAGTLHPGGISSPSSQMFEGFMFAFWGPMLALFVFSVARLRNAGLARQLATGGTLDRKPLLIGVAFVAGMAAFEAVLMLYFPALRDLFTLPTESMALAAAIFGVVAGAPVAEELVFRGFLQTALRARLGALAAIMVSGLLFATMHIDGTGMYALLVLPAGLMLGWLRETTGGIRTPVVIHALFNTVAVVVLLLTR